MTNHYLSFIEECKSKTYPPNTYLEEHHIVPKHDGGSDNSENLISLSFDDHILAHKIRYDVYGQVYDLAAYNLMCGFDGEGWRLLRVEGAYKTHEALRLSKKNFWSSDYQKEMSARSVKSEYAMKMRSVGGKIGGKNRNKNVAITSTDKYIFSHNKVETVCIINCETGGEVLEELQKIVPNQNFKRVTPLLKKQRENAYGWSCEKFSNTEISIQVSDTSEKGSETT
jgi:hypothetical protein